MAREQASMDGSAAPGELRWLKARASMARPVMAGLLIVAFFFGGGIGWAALAPLSIGVTAYGKVIVESRTKAVQHPSGGVVGLIHVREGDTVAAGDPLVTLETERLTREREALLAQKAAAQRQHGLLGEEIAAQESLLAKGLARRPALLALRRQQAELEKEMHRAAARIATLAEEIARAQVRAPVAGRVLTLNVHVRGAVVGPGATIAEIVPEEDRLVVEARLRPTDIDAVRPGMPAKVWLTALDMRQSRPLAARLVWISPDRLNDKRGRSYYRMRVEILREERAAHGPQEPMPDLYPGMPAEVLVRAGERTLLEQILDPLTRNLRRAWRG